MADDPLSSALEEIRERQRAYINAPALADESLSSWLVIRQTLCAEDVPRLLAAFRVLVVFHAQYMTTEEYAKILAALTGEESRG